MTVIEEMRVHPSNKIDRRALRQGIAATTCADLALGWYSWLTVQPGISLLGPMVLDTVTMGLALVTWYYVLKKFGGWRYHVTLWLALITLCAAPLIWTYFGVLQISIGWDSAATRTAQELISSDSTTCHVANVGSVGLLRAPYEVCAVNYPGYGYEVKFSTMDKDRGYAFIQGRTDVSWFPNQCARHLYGNWWAFNVSVNATTGSCPTGFPENPSG
jgi:hypothetical protein